MARQEELENAAFGGERRVSFVLSSSSEEEESDEDSDSTPNDRNDDFSLGMMPVTEVYEEAEYDADADETQIRTRTRTHYAIVSRPMKQAQSRRERNLNNDVSKLVQQNLDLLSTLEEGKHAMPMLNV